jgi:hypothetical protein
MSFSAPWDQIYKVILTDEFIYLYGAEKPLIVPRRVVVEAGVGRELDSLIDRNVSDIDNRVRHGT